MVAQKLPNGGVAIMGDFAPKLAKPLPAWVKPPKWNGLVPAVGQLALWGGLNLAWNSFLREIRWNELSNLLQFPWGAHRIAGWTRVCSTAMNCGSPWVAAWSNAGTLVCTVSCGAPSTTVPFSSCQTNPYTVPVGASIRRGFYHTPVIPPNVYWRTKEIWRREANSPANPVWSRLRPNPDRRFQPDFSPNADPWATGEAWMPDPMILPNIVPEVMPVAEPMPFPATRPWVLGRPQPLPGVEPAHQPVQTPQPGPAPATPFLPQPGVVVVPAPYPRAAINVGGLNAPPPVHVNRPRKGNEGKVKGSGAAAAAAAIFGGITEGLDVVDALWEALPAGGGWVTKVKGHETSLYQKGQDIYHATKAKDFKWAPFVAAAAKNLAVNQATDHAIGKVGRGVAGASHKAKPHGDLPYGFGFGPAL